LVINSVTIDLREIIRWVEIITEVLCELASDVLTSELILTSECIFKLTSIFDAKISKE
jgi:hypothetical protein